MSSACPTTTPVPRKTELSRSAKVKVHAKVSDSGSSYGPTVRISHAERLWLISLANLVYLFIWLSLFINNLSTYNLISWKIYKYVNVGFGPSEAYFLSKKFQLSLYTLYITSTILLITIAERSLITSKENSQSINHSFRDNQITKHDLTSKQKVCQFWYESLVLYSRKYASV